MNTENKYRPPFARFLGIYVVNILYNIVDNEYIPNFFEDFSTRFYSDTFMNNLRFGRKSGDYVIIKNLHTNYICFDSGLPNHRCNCQGIECFQETYSVAKIIGKYTNGHYKVMVYYDAIDSFHDYILYFDHSDVRSISINDIIGVVSRKKIAKRLALIQELESLPISIYKSE